MRLGDICHQVTDKANCEDAKLETYVSTESLLQNKQGRQQASSLPTTGKVTLYAAGDTLVSNIRPYFKKVWYAPFDGTCSGDVLVFRANEAEDAPYLHACLRQDRFFDHVMRGAKGTKMPRGDKKQMMEFCVSSTCGADDLSLMKAALNQIAANDAESANLEDLRDTLLPKLMSGEIDVSKVDLTQLNNHLYESKTGGCRGHPLFRRCKLHGPLWSFGWIYHLSNTGEQLIAHRGSNQIIRFAPDRSSRDLLYRIQGHS